MNKKENKLYSCLKLIVFFAVGFLVWKYALFFLDIVRSKGLLLGTAMHISMNLLFVAIGIIF